MSRTQASWTARQTSRLLCLAASTTTLAYPDLVSSGLLGETMPAFDSGFKIAARTSGRRLAIFGKLAYGQLDVQSLIGRELMKESAIYAEIGDEARVEEAQAAALAVLEERFGKPAASSCRDAIQRVTKLDKLRRLHRLAVRCTSVEEFQRSLPKR